MKIVRGAAVLTVLLLYPTFRHFLVSSKQPSSVSQHQNPSVFHIFIIAKPSYLVVAFTFNIIVVVLLLLGTFNPFSCSQVSGFSTSELYFFYHPDSHVHLPPMIDKDGSTLKDDHNKDNNNDDDNELVPRLVCAQYKEVDDDEKYGDGLLDDVYYEDSDDGSEEDDLNKRIEDFIVANNKKWKDELLNERLVYKRNFSTSVN